MNGNEKKFMEILGKQLEHFNGATNPLLSYLVHSGIIPERTVIRFLSISIYKKELERTKSKINPKGQKMLAIANTINQIGISERQLSENLKSYKKWFRLS
jgi:hypothetical protein